MAENQVFDDIHSLRRVITVPTHTAPGTALMDNGRPAVTQTGSGDYLGPLTSTGDATLNTLLGIGVGHGGIGLGPLQATVTYTGSFSFPVTGASAATAPGTTVYITSGGVLTLTSSGNTAWGKVDFFRGEDSGTDTVVKVGVTL